VAHALWKGGISFGLVNVPVALYAAENREAFDLTMLDRRSMTPIGYRKVNKESGEEVPPDQVVKGYEVEEGTYVVLEDEELKRASPERTQTIDIVAFVDGAEIDPTYFDRPYYLEPVGKNVKGYALLRETLKRTGKVGIARVVIRTKQYLAAVLARKDMIVLNLLRYPHELRDPSFLNLPGDADVSDKELAMAERLVGDMADSWDPSKYRDEYREELEAYIRKKAETGEVAAQKGAPAPRKGEVVDLMSLLKRSVDQREKGRRKKPA